MTITGDVGIMALMNSACRIEVEMQTKVSGMLGRNWSATATGVPCRVQGISGEARIEWGRLGIAVTNTFYFATDPCLSTANHRIVWEGWAYYPKYVDNQGGQLNKLFKVLAERKPLQYSTEG